MNILVTGCKGQLGTELQKIAARDTQHRWVFTDVDTLDICDKAAVETCFDEQRIDACINCAAYTAVDKAEDEPELATLINAFAPKVLAEACLRHDALLIHISTDYVFAGDGNTPIKESVAPAPRSVYGSTKLAGEKAIQKSGCKSIILRTAWLYSPYGRNFLTTMRSLMSSREELSVVCDQVGSPTCAGDLAALIMHIIATKQLGKTGLYHYSDEGAVSWYDFAMAIKDICGYTCKIRPCLSSEYRSKARRPQYSVLDKSLVKKTFGVEVPYWRDSLAECISRIK